MPRKSNKTRSDGRVAVQIYLGTVDGKRKYKKKPKLKQKKSGVKYFQGWIFPHKMTASNHGLTVGSILKQRQCLPEGYPPINPILLILNL